MAKPEVAEVFSLNGREVRVTNPDKLYFSRDVKLTKLIHEYGQRQKQLHYFNRFNKKLTVPVSW